MYRLLIIDNDADSCESIKNLLDWSVYGFSAVMTASSYVEAVNKALDLNPHVALISIRLGDHWGYELAEHLRSVGLKMSFCMLSDVNDPDYICRSMRAGANDFLLKPLNVQELKAFLNRILVYDLNGTLPDGSTVKNEIDPVLKVEYAKLSKITNKIILIIQSDYHSPQTLVDIAESFNMSSKYIGRVFLKDTGIRFTEYLMAYRMLEARKLIVNTQEKISVIANMVGYVQLNNFYTHFKNYFGVSPSSLRNFETTPESAEHNAVTGGNHENDI